MSRRIEVVPYNPAWPAIYEQEAQRVASAFGDEIVGMYHIGSTSILGIKAKPVIDIMVVVEDIEKIDDYDSAMQEIGYRPRGELDIPGRRYFSKDTGGIRSHQVHCYPIGHPEIERHLNFRDYLREHDQAAEAYGQLKEELAAQHRYDSHAYTKAKSDFIREMDRRAALWRKDSDGLGKQPGT